MTLFARAELATAEKVRILVFVPVVLMAQLDQVKLPPETEVAGQALVEAIVAIKSSLLPAVVIPVEVDTVVARLPAPVTLVSKVGGFIIVIALVQAEVIAPEEAFR
jgi:hypothetical protein